VSLGVAEVGTALPFYRRGGGHGRKWPHARTGGACKWAASGWYEGRGKDDGRHSAPSMNSGELAAEVMVVQGSECKAEGGWCWPVRPRQWRRHGSVEGASVKTGLAGEQSCSKVGAAPVSWSGTEATAR